MADADCITFAAFMLGALVGLVVHADGIEGLSEIVAA